MFGPPPGLRVPFFAKLRPGIVGGLAVVEFYPAQVVLVPALEVDQFSEQAFANHLQDRHDVAAVAYILQKHQVCARCLMGIHQLPAFVQGEPAADLCAHVFPGLHRGDTLLGMPFPGGSDHHGINVFVFQKPEVVVVPFVVHVRFFVAFFVYLFEAIGQHTEVGVGDGGYLAVVAQQCGVHVVLAAQPDPDKADAEFAFEICRRRGQGAYVGQGQCGTGQYCILKERTAVEFCRHFQKSEGCENAPKVFK